MDRPSAVLYVLIFSAALVASLALTPVASHFARRFGLQDQPGRGRAHLEPVSLMGGLAIFGAAALAAWILAPTARVELKGFLLAGFVVLVFGLQDDVTPMDPWIKFMAQVASALVLVGFGTQVELTRIPVVDVVITVAWVVAVINAFNYSDNMNGLAAGLAAVSGTGFFVLALIGDQYLVAALAIALVGGSLGFLPSNFPKAKIFMGDAGSMFLGLMLAFLGIRLRFLDQPQSTTFVLPVLVLAVPLLDAALVTVSRLRRGLRVTQGGSDHSSHRLVGLGMRPPAAVGLLWATQLLGCLAALAVLQLGTALDVVVIASVCGAALGSLLYLERVTITRTLPNSAAH